MHSWQKTKIQLINSARPFALFVNMTFTPLYNLLSSLNKLY